MKYISTRGHSSPVLFSEALQNGLAPDGGLYVPEFYPTFTPTQLSSFLKNLSPVRLTHFKEALLHPWLEGDPLLANLTEICESALNFPAPLTFLNENTALLELQHGPTAAFKDFGARFLSACISEMPQLHPGIILVATSGDTGGAVAAAFFRKPGIQVVILYPKDKISLLQERQLTTWGENVTAIAVRGTFDDCQRLVKEALTLNFEKKFATLISANCINLGRLLPQTTYYASSSLEYLAKTGHQAGYVIPTGNLGNAVAALWAKRMGFPIREVVLATNSNLTLSKYFQTGVWNPEPSVKTLANAMDVGNPNNLDRLNHLYPNFKALTHDVRVIAVNDEQIAKTIGEEWRIHSRVFCPHTATALFASTHLKGDWILVSTAHAAKFNEIIVPLVAHSVPLPPKLALFMDKKEFKKEVSADLSELKNYLNFTALTPKRECVE
jgi:threonine synthase